MNKIVVIHKCCGERIVAEYPSNMGHILTEEALALKRIIDAHICKEKENE